MSSPAPNGTSNGPPGGPPGGRSRPSRIDLLQTGTHLLRRQLQARRPWQRALETPALWVVLFQIVVPSREAVPAYQSLKAHVERRYSAEFAPPAPRMRDYVAAVKACLRAFRGDEPLAHDGVQVHQHARAAANRHRNQ